MRTIYDDQGINPRRVHINCICVYIYIYIYIYISKFGEHKYKKQILAGIKGQIDSNTIIVGDFAPHFNQWRDHPDRKAIKKHCC